MSFKNKINPNINKFFIKLYFSFQNIITIDKTLMLTETEHKKINLVYCNKNKTKWFVKTENENKNLFLFGKIEKDLPKPALLVLTFDKLSVYSPDCSGIINSKEIYINVQYFIDNYPNFKTKLKETTIDIFMNNYERSIDVIKLGEYSENIEEFLKNLDILLDELENYQPIETPENIPVKSENDPNIINNYDSKENKENCEICGKKLKRREKKFCKKCSKKRHAANILTKLLTHTKPNIPFTKKDLSEIYLEREINDFIWSLQDFNLIKQKNNEYCLVEQEILDEFIEKYSFMEDLQEPDVKKEEPKKLNKTCSICKKTLPISKFYKSKRNSDGFEDYCKKCKSYVTTASYLKYLLNNVKPGEKFKTDDLRDNYDDSLDLNGVIWKLQEFDLIRYDEDSNEYCLKNQEICQNFLEKYYIAGSITIKKNSEKTKKPTKKEQMNIVIENIKLGKTDKEAAEIAGINIYNITYWFNEGKNNSSDETTDFYKRYIEAKKEAKRNSFNNFYVMESFNNKRDLTIADTLRKQQMEKVLKEMNSGSSMKTASFNSGITFETLQYWYNRGKQNFGEEYAEFYEKINILKSPIETPKVEENNTSEIENKLEKDSKTNRTGHILDPLPKEYENTFKSSKNNKTGFAWVNKVGNQWFYTRNIDGQTVKFSNYDINKLYEEVLENNMIWGVRDLVKAKESLKEPKKSPTTVSKSPTSLITINVPVNKKDKKSLKLLAEHDNRSMRDLLTEEANNILNENKTINPHNKPKDSVYLLFQIDEDLKNQVNNYSSDFNDFWNTALDNILNKDESNIDEKTTDLDFYKSSENTSSNLVTVNVKVDKQDKIRIKEMSEFKNTSMKDLLNKEAMNILKENKAILPFNKTRNTTSLLFQLDENLKTQIETYSLRNNKNVRDFWYTALHNIINTHESENITSQDENNKNHSKTDIVVTYVRLENNKTNTIIQGLLDNNELIYSLNQLKVFEDNISRIITNKNNKGIDLFIEINIPLSYINNFEEIMSNLNWKINK